MNFKIHATFVVFYLLPAFRDLYSRKNLFSARIEDELIKLMINTNDLSENESRNAVNKYQLLITLFIILMKGKKKKTNNTVPYMKILYFQRTCILYFPSKRSVKYNV